MTYPHTRRLVWAFGAECSIVSAMLIFADHLPAWVFKTGSIVALAIPIVGYATVICEPSVYRAWKQVISELRRGAVAGVRCVGGCFSIKSIVFLTHRITHLKVCPGTVDDWFALVLFPFKVYVLIAVPFLWAWRALHAFFASDLVRISRADVLWPISAGFAACLAILLAGALLQALFSERGRSTQTLLVFLVGLCFFWSLWPWGAIG